MDDIQIAETGESAPEREVSFQWEAEMVPARSPVVLRQLSAVLGISVCAVWLFGLILVVGEQGFQLDAIWSMTRIMLAILGGLAALALLSMVLVYRRYRLRYTLDDEGVRQTTVGRTRRTNAIVNTLLMLSGRPTAAGAGLLAASRQSHGVHWDSLEGARFDQRRLQIELVHHKRVVMLLQCTADTWELVSTQVRARVPTL